MDRRDFVGALAATLVAMRGEARAQSTGRV